MSLVTLLALVTFATLVAYAVLAGADFGAGIWDLVARGDRRAAHQAALAKAIGPVWEANHVWLIFLVVLLFTCFPAAYAQASVALFWPIHLVLIGIVLRGAAYVFRAYAAGSDVTRDAWGHVFGASSAVTPILLGMCLGALSTGDPYRWYDPFPIATGVLALLICAYLAAVYCVGFLVGTPVYLFLSMMLHGGKSFLASTMTAIATTLAIWVTFEVLFKYPLYPGVLFGGL